MHEKDEKYTLVLSLTMPDFWPPKSRIEIEEIQLENGRLFLSFIPTGQIEFWFMYETEVEYGKYTVKASPKERTSAIEKPDNGHLGIQVGVSGASVDWAASEGCSLFGSPPAHLAEASGGAPNSRRLPDFAEENVAAIGFRRERLASFLGNIYPKHPGSFYDFEALMQEQLQIRNLLRLIEVDGQFHHVAGLLARERAVLTEKSNRLALLQLCAAHLDAPLVFEATYSDSVEQLVGIGNGLVGFSPIAGSNGLQLGGGGVLMDLDVWLNQYGLSGKGQSGRGQKFTNRAVIKGLGDGLGAHRLPTSNDVTKLMKPRPSMAGPKVLDQIGKTAISVGQIFLFLADKLIADYQARR